MTVHMMATVSSARSAVVGITVMPRAHLQALLGSHWTPAVTYYLTTAPPATSADHHAFWKCWWMRTQSPRTMALLKQQKPAAGGGMARGNDPHSVLANAEVLLHSGTRHTGLPAAVAYQGIAGRLEWLARLPAGCCVHQSDFWGSFFCPQCWI